LYEVDPIVQTKKALSFWRTPLSHVACWIKGSLQDDSGVAATYTPSLTTRLTRFNEPNCDDSEFVAKKVGVLKRPKRK
jgi:hypothetical protein